MGDVLGIISVRQDFRGTGKSEGYFELWQDAASDAYDTIEWLVAQPWCNGTVFTVGASADAIAEFAVMANPNPHLGAQALVFATSVAWETFYIGGAYREALIEGWLDSLLPNNGTNVVDQVKAEEVPGAWWQTLNGTLYYQNVKWSSVQWAGWYDIFQQGNLLGFEGYQHASDPSVRGKHKLVVDPCGHCQDAADLFPHNDILGRSLLPLLEILQMFDPGNANGGHPPPPEGAKAVTFYVMGGDENEDAGNYWTTVDDFPTFTTTPMYLLPGSTGLQSGRLSLLPPNASTPSSVSWVYNPANPVPTIGGNNLEIKCGPMDQRPIEAANRGDLSIFTSDVLSGPLAITGPLLTQLWVASNATDTDFVVKLIDVYPGNSSNPSVAGKSIIVADGILRMRWRQAPAVKTPQPMTPGQVYEVTVGMWNTSYIFAAGHRVRIHVTSSNWPRFGPNPNNGLPVDQTGPNITAQNTVYTSTAYPSALLLPVVDAKSQLPPFPVLDTVNAMIAAREPAWRARREAARAALVAASESGDAAAAMAAAEAAVPDVPLRDYLLQAADKVLARVAAPFRNAYRGH